MIWLNILRIQALIWIQFNLEEKLFLKRQLHIVQKLNTKHKIENYSHKKLSEAEQCTTVRKENACI